MTPLAAATATPAFPAGAVIVLALMWTAGYLFACWFWPYRQHRRCAGTGKLRSPGGRAWRSCPGCGGTGRALRAGRRLFNTVTTRGRP